MVQPGRDSPVKEVKDTNPSSSPKWIFRLPKARRKMKRPATPHPGKVGGNTKRDALVSLTETGRARKKIVFEFEEPAAGSNGGTSTPAGVDKVSSPSDERKGGRWTRKARPGPFEALHLSMDQNEVEPGVLPLLPRGLHFSMGKTETLARDQPEIVAGTRHEEDRPEKSAVAQEEARSTHMGRAACAAAMDEDTSPNGNGANMLSEPPTLAAPFPENASATCDSSHGTNNFESHCAAGAATLVEEANVGGEVEHDGKPPAPENPPEQNMV